MNYSARRRAVVSAIALGILLVAGASVSAAPGEGVSVSARVDKRSVLIGDRIRLAVEARYRKGAAVELPRFPDGKIGDFEIKESRTDAEKSLFGARRIRGTYEIAVYETGKQTIPALEIKYRLSESGAWMIKKTGEIAIAVQSTLPTAGKPSDIQDIKGTVAFFSLNIGLVAAGFLLVLLIGALLAYLKRSRRAPLRSPRQIALAELEEVRALLSDRKNIKEFYVRISDCVRRYIEAIFDLRAPEMTTEEFLGSVKGSGALSDAHKGLLGEFLRACDLVKFARHAPTESEAGSVFTAARNFIEEARER